MLRSNDYQMLSWLALAFSNCHCDRTCFWLNRASLTWATADGAITRLDIERKWDAGSCHYFCATFTYDFQDN